MNEVFGDAFGLIKVGEALLERCLITREEEKRIQLFLALVLIERSLDKVRTTYTPGSAGEFKAEFDRVNKGLDKIRNGIQGVSDGMDQETLKKSLEEMGRDISMRFVKNEVPPIPTPPVF